MAEAKTGKAQIKANKEMELERLRQGLEKEKLEVAHKIELQNADIEQSKSKDRTAYACDPKLPYIDDSKDKMEIYLSRFEKYTTANKWDQSLYYYLSAILKGRAFDVYDRLSDEDAASYDKLKESLLKNFDMTERGFHKKFLYSRPENKEAFIQF